MTTPPPQKSGSQMCEPVTVIRIDLTLTPTFTVNNITKIAQGYGFINNNTNPLVGPSGLAYSEELHTLYVTRAQAARIYAIANADTITTPVTLGTQIYLDGTHLHGPVGLALAPNGDLISAQADNYNVNPNLPSEIVELPRLANSWRNIRLIPRMAQLSISRLMLISARCSDQVRLLVT